jgi:hypothetical protein
MRSVRGPVAIRFSYIRVEMVIVMIAISNIMRVDVYGAIGILIYQFS